MSQEALALTINVSRQTINKWETNKTQPSYENTKALCSVFQVTITYFLENELTSEKQKNTEVIVSADSVSLNLENKTIENVSIDNYSQTKTTKHIGLIIGAVVDAILFVICIAWTIGFAFISFTSNNGGVDHITTDTIDTSEFVVLLFLSIILLVIEILIIVSIRKQNKKYQTTRKTK